MCRVWDIFNEFSERTSGIAMAFCLSCSCCPMRFSELVLSSMENWLCCERVSSWLALYGTALLLPSNLASHSSRTGSLGDLDVKEVFLATPASIIMERELRGVDCGVSSFSLRWFRSQVGWIWYEI